MVVTEKIILRTLGLSSFLIVLFVVSFFLDYRTAITVAVTTIAIPVAVGWYTYRKFPLPRALQILWVFLSVTLAFEAAGYIMQKLGKENLIILQVYSLFEYSLLTLVFIALHSSPRVRTILRWSIPAYIAAWTVSYFFFRDPSGFDNVILTIESILLCGMAILTLVDLVKNNFMIFWHYGFWIVISVLVYFSGNLVLFALWNFIFPPSQISDDPALFLLPHHILNLTMHLTYAVSFLCRHLRTSS